MWDEDGGTVVGVLVAVGVLIAVAVAVGSGGAAMSNREIR